MPTEIVTAVIAASAVLLGGLATGILGYHLAERRARADERRNYRKLAIETGFHEWRFHVDATRRVLGDEVIKWNIDDRSLDSFLAEMFELMDIASDSGKSLKETAALLAKRK